MEFRMELTCYSCRKVWRPSGEEAVFTIHVEGIGDRLQGGEAVVCEDCYRKRITPCKL